MTIIQTRVYVVSELPLFPCNDKKHLINYGSNAVASVFKTVTAMGIDNQRGQVSVPNGLEGTEGFICCFLAFSVSQTSRDSIKLSPYCHGYRPSPVIYFSVG